MQNLEHPKFFTLARPTFTVDEVSIHIFFSDPNNTFDAEFDSPFLVGESGAGKGPSFYYLVKNRLELAIFACI